MVRKVKYMNENIKDINVNKTAYQDLIKPYEKEALKTLQELIQIPSVHDEKTITADKPFGQEVENALSYIAKKGEELGFHVDRCDNYVTELSFGEGDKTFDIYAHLDVVPVKEKNWVHQPFSLIIDNDIMYGRGVSDDKGPAIACLYAVKALMDKKRLGGYKLRFLFGGNEERDSLCLEHYFHVLKKGYPTIGFSPDADYPLIYGEKSIYSYKASYDIASDHIKPFQIGDALNIVLAEAKCEVQADKKLVEELLDKYTKKHPEVKIKFFDNTLEFIGVPYHGSMPYNGVNAGLHMLNFLGHLFDIKLLRDIYDDYKDGKGEAFKGNYRDEYFDCTTYNIGKIAFDGKHLVLFVNTRFSPAFNIDTVIKNVTLNTGSEVELLGGSIGFIADPESEFIQTMLKSYQEETGDYESKPLAIGGGTYSRESKNTVAFGAQFPNRDYKMHGDDEFFPVSDFFANMQIYAHAIDALSEYLRKDK